MAAVPQIRQRLLYPSAAARPESRQGLGGTDGAASAVLYRHHRHSADRRAGAVAHRVVADDLIHRVQIAARGRSPHFPAWRADAANPGAADHVRHQPRADGRGGSRRARNARTSDSRHPADAGRGLHLDVGHRYRLRRHLSLSAARGKRPGPRVTRLERQSLHIEAIGALALCWSMIFSDLPSPAEAGFAKAGNRYPLFGIMLYPRPRSAAVIAAVVMMVVVMVVVVTMGRHEDDAGHHMVMM